MSLKHRTYIHLQQVIQEKITVLQNVLNDFREAGANETKSTAGDKHETALAMLQIEQANTRVQLQELLLQKAVLDKINPGLTPSVIVNGSLVKTNRGYFFMSTALGKVHVQGKQIWALSPQSPLGQQLMGLQPGDNIVLNDVTYTIESIE